MSSHCAIPACTEPKAPTHWNRQCSTMPHAAYLHSQVAVLCQLLSMFLANVAISRTADINKEDKTSVCLHISETDIWTIGFDLLGSGDGGIPHHRNVIHLHEPIRMMPEPYSLHWNPKMATNIPVNDGGHMIVSVSVVHRCQSTTACRNVVECFQAYPAHVASRTDIILCPSIMSMGSLPHQGLTNPAGELRRVHVSV